jgi:hypothetical protein
MITLFSSKNANLDELSNRMVDMRVPAGAAHHRYRNAERLVRRLIEKVTVFQVWG